MCSSAHLMLGVVNLRVVSDDPFETRAVKTNEYLIRRY
jgi:hypothetical protein